MRRLAPVRTAVLLIALAATSVPSIHAQSEPYAFIMYAEGFSMSVYRNDQLERYDVLVDDVLGMPLLPGDLIQTDADTFLEIQVMPSRTVVKVAENTTFEIERLGGAGGGSFRMSYGRMRARVERLTNQETFQVRGEAAVAGVRGTDFGYDVVVERERNRVARTRVYVFEGEVAVTEALDESDEQQEESGAGDEEETESQRRTGPSESAESGDSATEPPEAEAQEVVISAGAMVDIRSPAAQRDEERRTPEAGDPQRRREDVQRPQRVVFRSTDIEEQIEQFWTDQDFREEALDPSEVEERFPGINARVETLTEERRRYEELQRMRREGVLNQGGVRSARTEDTYEPEPEREPNRSVQLREVDEEERIKRMITRETATGSGASLRRAGRWMIGTGLAMELAGLAAAYYVDGAREADDLRRSGPTLGVIAGGGVFITSGLVSMIAGLIAGD